MSITEHSSAADLQVVAQSPLELRPITPDDYPFLFHIATTGRNAMTWRFRGHMLSMAQFVASLDDSVLVQCVVTERGSGRPIGHVVAYNPDLRSGHCYVGAVMDEQQIGLRAGREALNLFIDYLFKVWNLRKVYAEVPAFVFEGVEPGVRGAAIQSVFDVEGTLSEHLFCGGRYWDVMLVAVRADRWPGIDGVRDAWASFGAASDA